MEHQLEGTDTVEKPKLTECHTEECQNKFDAKGTSRGFCDECLIKKYGKWYMKRYDESETSIPIEKEKKPEQKTEKRKYKKRRKYMKRYSWQKPHICEEDGCETVFTPEDSREKYCPEHRTGSAASRRYIKKKNKGRTKRKEVDIDKMIEDIIPKSSRKKDYKIAVKLIIKNPKVVYSQIIKKHPINLSDAMFYQLRIKVNDYLGIPKDERFENPPRENSVENVKRGTYNIRKKGIYTTVFEKEVNGGCPNEAKELLLDFIETLKNSRVANFELIELSYPIEKIEVREIK